MIESLGSLEGKYEILERIGEGGMGAIYKVRHRLINDLRVIKTMRAHLSGSAESRERFFREARLAARVKHENIAQVLDFSMDEDTAFLVMEYIDGVTLQDILDTHGAPSLPLALEIAQQSLRALAIVHKTGIIHRDISPDNLMLTQDSDGNPRVKLIDLGLAKLTDADSGLTKEGFFLGKLRYAAPEQFQSQDEAPVGTWSDVYSFGLVFYQLVTGRYPIRGHDMTGLMAGHVSHPPLPFSDSDPEERVPDDLRQIILRSLEKRSEDRFPTGESFHDQVRLIQTSYPIGQAEKDEAFDLTRSRPADSETLNASSDQSRIDGAFRPDKSSAGDSHSEDATASVEMPGMESGRTLESRDKSLKDTAGREGVRPDAKPDKTIIRPSDHDVRDAGISQKGRAPFHQPPPITAESPPPPTKIDSDRAPLPFETSSARVAPRFMWSKRMWLATAATLVIGAAVLVTALPGVSIFSLFGRGVESSVGSVSTGSLVLNANPWAEVVSITNASGNIVQIDGNRFTPLVLSLEPGMYDVLLRHEEYGEKTVEVEVSAGHTTSETVPLATIDEDFLLRSLGAIE